MEGPIERLIPRVRILPPQGGGRRHREQTRRRFSLPDEESGVLDAAARNAEKEEPASPDLALDEDRPVGHAADDESGSHLDLTA